MSSIVSKGPALRFKNDQGNEYKDWEVISLSQLGETYGGLSGKSKDDFGVGKKYVQYLQVFENSRVNLANCGLVRILQGENQHRVRKGDVLFTISSETRDEVGISSVMLDEIDELYLNSFCFGLRLKSNKLSAEFARYLFRNHEFRKGMYRLSQGSTRFNLSKKAVMRVCVVVPHHKEQQKIAAFLSSIDTRIEQLENRKFLFEQFKKGLMQKLFSQEIRFKNDQGEEYPEWEEKYLGDVGKIIGGGTPNTQDKSLWNGSIVWYTPVEIAEKYSSSSIRAISTKGLKHSSAKVLPAGSVLFTSRATIGKVTIALCECTTNQGFQSFVVNHEYFSNEFLYYWLTKNVKEFVRRANGSTYLEVSGKEIKKIRYVVPCLEEQQKVASFLSSIDQKIELISEQIEKTRNFKNGLLQQMFV